MLIFFEKVISIAFDKQCNQAMGKNLSQRETFFSPNVIIFNAFKNKNEK